MYPESAHSSLSSPLNALIKKKLREHALILRRSAASLRDAGVSEADAISSLRAQKEMLLREVYGIMTSTLGVIPKPDEKFSWDYIDKDGKVGHWEGTPCEFYKVCHNVHV